MAQEKEFSIGALIDSWRPAHTGPCDFSRFLACRMESVGLGYGGGGREPGK